MGGLGSGLPFSFPGFRNSAFGYFSFNYSAQNLMFGLSSAQFRFLSATDFGMRARLPLSVFQLFENIIIFIVSSNDSTITVIEKKTSPLMTALTLLLTGS